MDFRAEDQVLVTGWVSRLSSNVTPKNGSKKIDYNLAGYIYSLQFGVSFSGFDFVQIILM